MIGLTRSLARAFGPDNIRVNAIARAALFLAADDSRMITRQCLIVDGGLR